VALEFEVHILCNPYGDTIPAEEFQALMESAIDARARDIETRFLAGEYSRNQMAFVVLDPTAPAGALADDIVMVVAVIGAEADFFAPNAMAKAFCYRDHGTDGAALVASASHRLGDGSFRFGGAIEVAGTIVGGSGQTELQDRYQCTLLAADFNYAVQASRKNWEEANGPGRWYLNEQAAGVRFNGIVAKARQG
jgi:hypothetical protein